MSVPGLFVPTYGKNAAAGQASAAKQNTSSRALPPKPIAPQPKPKQSGPGLPSLVFNGNVEYIQTWEAADQAARAIEAAGPGVLGFDIEWQVSFVKGQAPSPTATLQLCAPEHPDVDAPPSVKSSPVWGTAYIFHLIHMRGGGRYLSSSSDLGSEGAMAVEFAGDKGVVTEGSRGVACVLDDQEVDTGGSRRLACLPESLVRVLSDPSISLAGIGVNGDVCRLEKEYEQLRACGVNGVVDLSLMANMKEDPELRRRGMWSLADLCAQVLDLDLAKPDALRKGSWEKRPLNLDQLFYAAADAYAGLRLWQVMKPMPDLPILQPSAGDGRDLESGGVEQSSAARPTPGGGGGGGRGTRQARLPQSKLETHRMWYERGLSVEAVAEARCNKTSTVLGYLADCIEAGLPYDWDRINIASDTEKEIVRALLEVASSKAAASAAAAAAVAAATTSATATAEALAAANAAGTVAAATPGTAASKAGRGVAARTLESVHAENVMPDGSHSTLASKPLGEAQGGTCGHCPTGTIGRTVTAVDGGCNTIMPVAPTEASVKRQRRLDDSCASLGVGCVVADGLSRANCTGRSQGECGGGVATGAGTCSGRSQEEGVSGVVTGPGKYSGRSQGEKVGVSVVAEKVGATVRDGVKAVEANAASRWGSVGLREVKELAPGVEYWQIRLVLARFRSGWCGCARSE